MPGMHLKPEQVHRLCGVERDVCQTVLDSLVDARVLRVSANGHYARVTVVKRHAATSQNEDLAQASCHLRSEHVGMAERSEPQAPEALGSRHDPGAGVGCHRRSGLRRRLVHGYLGTEPYGDWYLHAKRGAPPGFQEGPPRLCGGGQCRLSLLRAPLRRRRTLSAGRRDSPPRGASSINVDCG